MAVLPIVHNVDGVRREVEKHQPTPHDFAVLNLIHRVIEEKYQGTIRNRGGEQLATVAFVLEKCQVPAATRSGTGDTVARDAEYYFKSRWVVARRKWAFTKTAEAVWMDAKNVGYNSVKWLAIRIGVASHLRSDADVPVTPPGGIYWGFKGALDGLNDQPDALSKPKLPTLPAPRERPLEFT